MKKIKRRCFCGCGSITNYGRIYISGHNRRGLKPDSYKHGFAGKHPLYQTWLSMKNRCYNKNYKEYFRYGKRGIRVCIRWRLSFTSFLKDVGKRPSEIHSIDRKDNDGNYTPDNCRWATPKEQSKNTRDNIWLTYKGKTLILKDWARRLNISYETLYTRYRKGLKPKEILSSINLQNGEKL